MPFSAGGSGSGGSNPIDTDDLDAVRKQTYMGGRRKKTSGRGAPPVRDVGAGGPRSMKAGVNPGKAPPLKKPKGPPKFNGGKGIGGALKRAGY